MWPWSCHILSPKEQEHQFWPLATVWPPLAALSYSNWHCHSAAWFLEPPKLLLTLESLLTCWTMMVFFSLLVPGAVDLPQLWFDFPQFAFCQILISYLKKVNVHQTETATYQAFAYRRLLESSQNNWIQLSQRNKYTKHLSFSQCWVSTNRDSRFVNYNWMRKFKWSHMKRYTYDWQILYQLISCLKISRIKRVHTKHLIFCDLRFVDYNCMRKFKWSHMERYTYDWQQILYQLISCLQISRVKRVHTKHSIFGDLRFIESSCVNNNIYICEME